MFCPDPVRPLKQESAARGRSLDIAAREGQDRTRDVRSEETLLDVAVAIVADRVKRPVARPTQVAGPKPSRTRSRAGTYPAPFHAHVAFKAFRATTALRRTIASCVHCKDSRSLRYNPDLQAWVCFQGCGNIPAQKPGSRRSPKRLSWKRSPLFEPYVILDGVRSKVRHTELREAYRLWAAHKDIREGRFRG